MSESVAAKKLSSCPFCGGNAHIGHSKYSRPIPDCNWDDGSPITETFYGHCARCPASHNGGIVGGFRTVSEAASRWNSRK